MPTSWDSYFLNTCETIAMRSHCLSRQIGALLVRDNIIISTGYNGPPRGIPHCGVDRLKSDTALLDTYHIIGSEMCPRQILGYKSGEGLHLCPAVHAEDNCISNAARIGVSTIGSTIYMSCNMPCKDCLKKIINAGIVEIVCVSLDAYDELSKWLLQESDIKIRVYEKK